VNVEGKAEIMIDRETKEKCWHKVLEQFFSSPDDPNYVVIKVTPASIEYTETGEHEPKVYVA